MVKFAKKEVDEVNDILEHLYYDPKTGYGGVQALSRQARAQGYKIPLGEIRRWLKEQDTYTRHKSIHRQFERQRTRVTDIDEQWQLDLADVSNLKKTKRWINFFVMCH